MKMEVRNKVKKAVKAETPVKAKARKTKVIIDPEKQSAFVNGEIEKVSKILDGIAERTGHVFVVLNRRFASKMIDVSDSIIYGTQEVTKVLKQRMDRVECYVKSSGLGTEQKGGQN